MAGSLRKMTARKMKLLATVQQNPGLIAQQLSKESGLDPSFVRRTLLELQARYLVKSVTRLEYSRRCWYSLC